MSGRQSGGLARGALAGAAAYAVGAGLVVAAGVTGFHPDTGPWSRLDGAGYLLVHQAGHIPAWQLRPQWAIVPFTLCLGAILVGAGFAAASGDDEANFQSGQTIVAGYFPPALAATVLLLVTNGAVTAVRMVALLLLVGVVAPALFGGVGGELASRYR